MKFEKPVPVQDIARKIGADIKGDEGAKVYGMNEIHNVREGDLTFVDAEKYYKFTLSSEATVIIIDKEVDVPRGKTILVVEAPFHAYNEIALSYRKLELQQEPIHPTADIHPTAEISVGCVIGKNVEIGAQSFVGPNTVVHDHCAIGNNVIIHANTTIGSDAFYYKGWNNKAVVYEKMNSIGSVIIHDDVEIGSGCTIDRGVSGATEIGQGTKIDNQVHVGHEVQIGRNCLLAAQVGVAGNVVIGNDVKVWGQVGIAKNLKIVDNVELLAQAGVARNIEKSGKYFGAPAGPARIKMKELKILERLPLLWKSLLKQMG